jgi:uncharacterized integral membrane protein
MQWVVHIPRALLAALVFLLSLRALLYAIAGMLCVTLAMIWRAWSDRRG